MEGPPTLPVSIMGNPQVMVDEHLEQVDAEEAIEEDDDEEPRCDDDDVM